MLDVLAFVALGIALGVFTGLIPGIHTNNLTPFFVTLAAGSSLVSLNLAALIVAMAITNAFIYIPATFLGAPEPEPNYQFCPRTAC